MENKETVKYIDNHAHLNHSKFDEDREQVLKRAGEAGVTIINVGTGKDSSLLAVEIAEKNENCFAIVGLHPTDTDEVFDYEYYKSLATHPKVVGIGECGLDFYRITNGELRITNGEKERQTEIFEEHIKLALELGKPLMLHIRDAYKEALEILSSVFSSHLPLATHHFSRGNVHFFAGSIEDAKKFLDLGITLSFTGAITYPQKKDGSGCNYEEIIKYVPLDMILSETDCPYVAPVPYRSKRNEPAYVVEVVKKIAEIKNLPLEEVSKQLLANSKRVWGITSI